MSKSLVCALSALLVASSIACASPAPAADSQAPPRSQVPPSTPVQAPAQTPAATAAGTANLHAVALVDFTTRLNVYVQMRNKADDNQPKQKQTSDASKIKVAEQALQGRIQAMRAGAKHGDIFTPEITAVFKRLLRREADSGTKAAILDDNPGTDLPFKVNAAYPEKETLSTVPPEVLATLPELPKDIEYRFGGKHMILRDARANLIIDYLFNAIP